MSAAVTEIMVNGPDKVYVERGGKLFLTNARFSSEDHLRRIIERIVTKVGRRIDESSPMVDARLSDGSRVNAIIPPLAVNGCIADDSKVRAGAPDRRQPDLVRNPDPGNGGAVARLRPGPAEHHRLRRYGHRKNDPAQCPVLLPAGR